MTGKESVKKQSYDRTQVYLSPYLETDSGTAEIYDVEVVLFKDYDALLIKYTELLETLKKAHEHLEYCGYGDSWESECAEAIGLPDLIEAALERDTEAER